MESVQQPAARVPSLTFKTSALWSGDRSGTLSADGRPCIAVSSPPAFKGERGVWTPEDLFVGAIELCHMNTFMAFAERKRISVLSFRSHANGVLEFVEGDYRFTRIVIFPTITVGRDVNEAEIYALLKKTEQHCLLTNSIASIVEVNPTIIVQ
jgi:peroxiredoxin-like protein